MGKVGSLFHDDENHERTSRVCAFGHDFTGEREAEGRFLLRHVTWDEANARAIYAPPSATPESLVYEGFDGTAIHVAGGLVLFPDGFIAFPSSGKRQLFDEGRELADEETVSHPVDVAP